MVYIQTSFTLSTAIVFLFGIFGEKIKKTLIGIFLIGRKGSRCKIILILNSGVGYCYLRRTVPFSECYFIKVISCLFRCRGLAAVRV